MIPATNPVTAFDPATGQPLAYDQWVPVAITISSPDDESDAEATPTIATVSLTRCRTVGKGKTQRLPEATARAVGRDRQSPQMVVPNIYAPATDQEPFVPEEYPPKATDEEKAAIDKRNAAALADHEMRAAVYPAAVRAAILDRPPVPLSLMELMLRASAALAAAREVL